MSQEFKMYIRIIRSDVCQSFTITNKDFETEPAYIKTMEITDYKLCNPLLHSEVRYDLLKAFPRLRMDRMEKPGRPRAGSESAASVHHCTPTVSNPCPCRPAGWAAWPTPACPRSGRTRRGSGKRAPRS